MSVEKLRNKFVEKAVAIYGDNYDYSDIKYVNNRTHIFIKCNVHNCTFKVLPQNHTRKNQICNLCKDKVDYRTTFINKSIELYGDKYNYDEVVYTNNSTYVNIKCTVHDCIFQATPQNHISKNQICNFCRVKVEPHNKLSIEKIIERSKKVHGNKYDYANTQRIDKIKISIVCPKHGYFVKNIRDHFDGSGCNDCVIKKEPSNKLTIEQIIERAKKVHVDKYIYENTKRIESYKMTFECPKHGECKQLINKHINQGTGCRDCHFEKLSFTQRKDVLIFIEEATILHNNFYTYENVFYINNKTNVCINCPIHDYFYQTPKNHLKGEGCIKCRNDFMTLFMRSNTAEFIEKAKILHNNLYDYSKVNYVDSRTEVTIICNIHDEFTQKPTHHLRGHGCYECGIEKMSYGNRSNTAEFTNKAKIIHDNLYDYSITEYIDCYTKVKIICNKHDIFEKTPYEHLSGYGCQKCSYEKRSNIDEFVIKAKKIHGESFNYDNVNYINSQTKVIIGCKKHGNFEQLPYSHLAGHGCLKCCYKTYSKISCEWLDKVAIQNNIFIQHALNKGEFYIEGIGKVDGYCKETNTVYELNGDFFHSNPQFYDLNTINPLTKKSMRNLYNKTLLREILIMQKGYTLVSMWESDYLRIYKNIVKKPKFK